MTSKEHVATEISNHQSDLSIEYNPVLKFTCNICSESGDLLLCFCNKCKRSMHPSCAGVSSWVVPRTDGNKDFVPPESENLPNSCPKCLRELKDGYSVQPTSSSSITSYLELGKEPLHKIVEGQDQWMLHKHKPGHELRQMDNSTIYSCNGCKMESFGLHYACENSSCTFLLHKECNSPRKFTEHKFFPGLTFVFSRVHNTSDRKHSKKAHSNIFCNACGMNVKGYYYHSLDGEKNLHPSCINLAAKTLCRENDVTMVLKEKTTSVCGYCNQTRVKVDRELTDNIWSYVTENENVHLHVGCMIKMLSYLKKDKMGNLKSCKMTFSNGEGNINLELELQHARMWSRKEKLRIFFSKYAKIALGTIIAALLGDATTLIIHSAASLISQ